MFVLNTTQRIKVAHWRILLFLFLMCSTTFVMAHLDTHSYYYADSDASAPNGFNTVLKAEGFPLKTPTTIFYYLGEFH